MAMVFHLFVAFNTIVATTTCVICNDIPDLLHSADLSEIAANEETKLQSNLQRNQIPLDFYRELSNVTDYIEFFQLFDGPGRGEKSLELKEPLRLSENIKRSVERASALTPKPAICMPESTIVPLIPLNPSKDPFIIYVPSCTRVKRCGGCCGPQLSCQPTETETLNFQILEYQYGERSPRSKQIIPIEQHLKCICDCRIKPDDCNSYQTYDSKNCRCDCTNSDEKTKCNALEHKIWDEQECQCVCRDSHSCTTGTYFDENQCKCLDFWKSEAQIASSTHGLSDHEMFGLTQVGQHTTESGEETAVFPFDTKSNEPPADKTAVERRRFVVKAVPVDPDNSTLYFV